MNKAIRTGLLIASVTLAGLVSSRGSVHADVKPSKIKVKMAFVDVERCVGETEDGLRAKATLKKQTERKQAHIGAIEERLKRQQDELAAQAQANKGGANPQLAAAVLQYQRDLQAYQETLKKTNADLAALEDQLFVPIEKKVKAIFTRLGEKNGYDIIVDRKAMPVPVKPELDLTEQVIQEYNWGSPDAPKPAASATTPPPPPPPVPSATPPKK